MLDIMCRLYFSGVSKEAPSVWKLRWWRQPMTSTTPGLLKIMACTVHISFFLFFFLFLFRFIYFFFPSRLCVCLLLDPSSLFMSFNWGFISPDRQITSYHADERATFIFEMTNSSVSNVCVSTILGQNRARFRQFFLLNSFSFFLLKSVTCLSKKKNLRNRN